MRSEKVFKKPFFKQLKRKERKRFQKKEKLKRHAFYLSVTCSQTVKRAHISHTIVNRKSKSMAKYFLIAIQYNQQ
jgi:hypothetical protein